MTPRAASLCTGLVWLCLTQWCSGTAWYDSDNGKELRNIDTQYPLQDDYNLYSSSKHLCVGKPIMYKHTILNSGPHRRVAAKSGDHLYCPPKRWLHNLKHRSVVLLLYHPCVSAEVLNSLEAHSCMSHYHQLSRDRPFASVSWGVIEMSQVTMPAVCEWLVTAFSNFSQASLNQRAKYSLYLVKPAPLLQQRLKVLRQGPTRLKSLIECCKETLSLYERERSKVKSRRGRAAILSLKENIPHETEKDETAGANITNPIGVQEPNLTLRLTDNISASHRNTRKQTLPKARDSKPLRASERDEDGKRNKTSEKKDGMREGGTERHPHRKTASKHRIKTDAEEQSAGEDCPGQIGPCDVLGTALSAGRTVRRERIPVPRTAEAVWAAAALGFLLVLLTLSILHTRLYRQWRPPPSLYWQHAQQDYESVADIIRRRLRMPGRKKRRASCRRQESALLPRSSSEEESV